MNLNKQVARGLSTTLPLGYEGVTREKPQYDVLELEGEGHSLVLHNDDINTFAHVITCLMQYCEHSAEQAEQCAWIVHLKGKCSVKSGSYDDLVPLHAALGDQGLQVTIE
jgi:ATP-dependent Clp protease adaptor protein ClpS